MGAGTTAVVAEEMGRKWIGSEINPEYIEITHQRINNISPSLDNFFE
jgi:DNA modification methylase